jgi:uncharacterized protein (DUF2225 family)
VIDDDVEMATQLACFVCSFKFRQCNATDAVGGRKAHGATPFSLKFRYTVVIFKIILCQICARWDFKRTTERILVRTGNLALGVEKRVSTLRMADAALIRAISYGAAICKKMSRLKSFTSTLYEFLMCGSGAGRIAVLN